MQLALMPISGGHFLVFTFSWTQTQAFELMWKSHLTGPIGGLCSLPWFTLFHASLLRISTKGEVSTTYRVTIVTYMGTMLGWNKPLFPKTSGSIITVFQPFLPLRGPDRPSWSLACLTDPPTTGALPPGLLQTSQDIIGMQIILINRVYIYLSVHRCRDGWLKHTKSLERVK